MLKSIPYLNPEKSQKALEAWKKLKPMTIEEIAEKSSDKDKIDFTGDHLEYKEIKSEEKAKMG